MGVLAGAALAVALMLIHDTAMKGFGRALDQHWATNVGYPSVDDAYARTDGKDTALEQAHNACKARSDFAGRARPRTPADILSDDAVTLLRYVAYLSCLATEKPARFCQSAHRTHLLAATKDYYRLMAKMREERLLSASEPFATNKVIERRAAPPPPPLDIAPAPEIAAALRTLVVGGYVARRELLGAATGWPNDLDTVLHGIDARQKGCG